MFWVGCVDGHSMSSTWLDSMTNCCTSNLVGNDRQYRPDPHGMRDPRRDLLVVDEVKATQSDRGIQKIVDSRFHCQKKNKKTKHLEDIFA